MSLPVDRILDLALRLLLALAVILLIAWFQAAERRRTMNGRMAPRPDRHQRPMSALRRAPILGRRASNPPRIDRRA